MCGSGRLLGVVVITVLLLSAGQSGAQALVPTLDAIAAARVPIALAPGDKIRVTVFGEDKLSGAYAVDAAGFVSLPLAGTVKGANLSRAELETSLARRYKSGFLLDPKITVYISSYRPFYILGEVEKPGEYTHKSGLNVLSATAGAGGPTYRASKDDVPLHKGGTGPILRVPLSPTIPVLPGNLIRVSERYL